jgi:PAS domain S-box-containing protein
MKEKEIASLLTPCLLYSQTYFLIITNFEGDCIFVNEVFRKRFSFLRPDLLGIPFLATVHPDDIEKCIEAAEDCITHPEKMVSLQIRKPNALTGDFYWMSWEFSLFKDATHQPIGILCLGHDINEERQTQESLQDSENKLRAILDSTTDSNILISPDLKILSFNKVAQNQISTFYNKEIQEGEDFRQYIIAGHEEIFDYNFKKAFLLGESVRSEKEIPIAKDIRLWFAFSFIPVYDKEGKAIGVSYNTTNINSQKRAEEKLKQTEYMLSAVYHSTTEASILMSIDYHIIYFNKAASEMTIELSGQSLEVGSSYLSYVLPDFYEGFMTNFSRALAGENTQVERTDGQYWYQFLLFPIYDRENKMVGVANNIQNITQRKNDEVKITEQNEQLKAIAWQQSHEVRRPVATILGLIQLIKMENRKGYNETYLNYLLQATEELDAVIHRIVAHASSL